MIQNITLENPQQSCCGWTHSPGLPGLRVPTSNLLLVQGWRKAFTCTRQVLAKLDGICPILALTVAKVQPCFKWLLGDWQCPVGWQVRHDKFKFANFSNFKSFVAFPAPTTAALPPIILAKLAALHGWPHQIKRFIMISGISIWQIMKRWLSTQICLPRSLRLPQDQEMPESKKEGLLRWSSLLVSAEIRWISATLCSFCD